MKQRPAQRWTGPHASLLYPETAAMSEIFAVARQEHDRYRFSIWSPSGVQRVGGRAVTNCPVIRIVRVRRFPGRKTT